ncbi:MAG: hypothetical protein Q7T74_03165 [Candidatus Saccharibacteria bacterium]|nr:hypothetical protein [Candidatus Saccharibacteria bacterium]
MSTKYTFEISPCGANLVLEKFLVSANTWNDIALSDKLTVNSGFVDSTSIPGKLICHSGPPDKVTVITLNEAGWESKVGATDSASCDSCTDQKEQTWVLTKKE